MPRKRKYAKIFDKNVVADECTKRSCKWQGTDNDKVKDNRGHGITYYVCPKCGNDTFYGILYLEPKPSNIQH